MTLNENQLYMQDIAYLAALPLPWHTLKNKRILISGATGMIGSCLVDLLVYRNTQFADGIDIIALSRNKEYSEKRFSYCAGSKNITLISHDVCYPLPNMGVIDLIVHAASNTHPVSYATDPIGTITTNVQGTINLLNYLSENQAGKFLLTSSVEIYGENRGDVDYFDEQYCGYIDCNTMRAGYPESKRVSEALCQAYITQKQIHVGVARLARTYGPTMLMTDTKAISQFIIKGLNKQNIVLKSDGQQRYSYCHVIDAVSAMLYILFYGNQGEAFNVASPLSDIALKDLAQYIGSLAGTKVIIEMPDRIEAAGYSKAVKALMDSKKITQLGWKPLYDIEAGIKQTLAVLSSNF
jgi:UDP-glucuronate decarboxylase